MIKCCGISKSDCAKRELNKILDGVGDWLSFLDNKNFSDNKVASDRIIDASEFILGEISEIVLGQKGVEMANQSMVLFNSLNGKIPDKLRNKIIGRCESLDAELINLFLELSQYLTPRDVFPHSTVERSYSTSQGESEFSDIDRREFADSVGKRQIRINSMLAKM